MIDEKQLFGWKGVGAGRLNKYVTFFFVPAVHEYSIEETDLGDLSNINEVIVSDTAYQLDIGENENFLFIMTTSKGFERHVYENV